MKTILRVSLALGLLTGTASAFSLLGPYDVWMQPATGYRLADDIGGPMNLAEEYRWNVPVITYTFDQSFLDYFGSNGVAAVEQAIQILNDLPAASQINPASYPAETSQVNAQAAALNLIDLKSKALSTLLEQLGLAAPTRNTFCTRDFGFFNGELTTQTIQRNFDPIDFSISTGVNDTAYNYVSQPVTNGAAIAVIAEEFAIDPLDRFAPAVADGVLSPGQYYTGLTRDDVGGLRYLHRTNNLNMEVLLPNVHGVGANAGAYANQALRRGVDKITFVRRDYDALLGQYVPPYTNQFTDYYITNNTVVAQQLERVVTEPDILFSRATGNGTPQIIRTGTSNWLNSGGLPGLAGPGLIRPPIKLALGLPNTVVRTSDASPDGNAGHYVNRWGSFDASTNAPVVYPVGATQTNLTLNLQLRRDGNPVGATLWNIALAPQETVVVQTSTNLKDWFPYLVFGAGSQVEWIHECTHSQRYFRIVPNE